MLLREFIAANSHRSCLLPSTTVINQTKKSKFMQEEQSFLQEEQKHLHHDRRAVCYSTAHDIYTNLAIEEAFLRGVYLDKHDKLLMFYVNSPCLIIGRNQNVFSEVALRRACNTHIDIARRGSGGGAVYHDAGNLCLSLFTHRTQYDPSWLISFLTHALASLLHIPFTAFTTTSRHDLFVNERKVTGSAMRVQRDIAMHHCTLLVNSELSTIGPLLRTDGEYVRFRSSSTSSVRSSMTSLNLISHELETHNKLKSNYVSKSENCECFSDTNEESSKHTTWNVEEVRDYLAHYFLEYKELWEFDKSSNNHETKTMKRVEESEQHKWTNMRSSAFNRITKLDLLYKSQKPSVKRATCWNNFLKKDNKTISDNFSYENFKFIYADGRPPQRGDCATFSDEIEKLQSCKWLLDMPLFTSTIAITQGEMQKMMLEIVHRQLELQEKQEEEEESEKMKELHTRGEHTSTPEKSMSSDEVFINSWLEKTLFVEHDKERQLCIDTTVDHGVITSITVTLSQMNHEQLSEANDSVSANQNSYERIVSITNSNIVNQSNQSVHEKQKQQEKKEKHKSHTNNTSGEVEWLRNFLSSLLVKTRLEELLHLYENVGLSGDLCNVASWVLQGLEMEASRANVEIEIDADNFYNTDKTLYLNAFVSALFQC